MERFKQNIEGNVAIVTMNSGENRFNYDFFNAFHALLDELEAKPEINVLVVDSSHEKIWSNGIDLEWIAAKMEKEGPGCFDEFGKEMYRLFIRLLTFPMITIAAITGHAFAGGAIMACAFDFRFMRDDRGWFCFPEIDIKIPFTDVLNSIALTAMPVRKLNEMQLSGERLTAQECQQQNIVHRVCSLENIVQEAVEKGKELNKDRAMISKMKSTLYADLIKLHETTIEEYNKSKSS